MELFRPASRKRFLALIAKDHPEARERRRVVGWLRTGRPWVDARIKELLKEAKASGVQTFLDDPVQFRWLQALFRAKQVVAVRGDLTARRTMRAVGQLAEEMKVPVRVLYLSNAERYFPWTRDYRKNVLALPFDERTVVLRTTGMGRWGDLDPFWYVNQKGSDFKEWIQAPKVKGFQSLLKLLKKTEKKYLYTLEDLPEDGGLPARARRVSAGKGKRGGGSS